MARLMFLLLVTLLCALTFSAPAVAQPSIAMAPCQVDRVPGVALCGTLEVIENRRTRQGLTLPLRVVILPARQPNPMHGPIYYLAGGPGETATELTVLFADAPEREDFDLVFIDQRGTGPGHFLGCPPPAGGAAADLAGPFHLPTVASCRERLERTFDLSQYHTAAWVEDIDEVRRALGHERINIIAASFGTYSAQRYVRRHGRRVRAAYLLGPVPMANRVPLFMPRDSQRALDHVFAQCAADVACATAYPRLVEDFDRVLTRLRGGSVHVTLPAEGDTPAQDINFTEAHFVDGVRVFLYRSPQARQLPFLISRAAEGDFTTFAAVAARSARGFYGNVRSGLAFAVTCNEFVNRIADTDVEPAASGSFLGRHRIDAQRSACALWPVTDRPRDYVAPFRSSVPTLMVSGDTDPVAPPVWAETLRATFRRSRHLIIANAGHTEENECLTRVRHAFFKAADPTRLDVTCMTDWRPPTFRLN